MRIFRRVQQIRFKMGVLNRDGGSGRRTESTVSSGCDNRVGTTATATSSIQADCESSLLPAILSHRGGRFGSLYGQQPEERQQQHHDQQPQQQQREQDAKLDNVLVTPPPPDTEPVLLLEGDPYHLVGGLARSLYRIVGNGKISSSGSSFNIAVEELYDLERCRKSFVIRDAHVARKDTTLIGQNHSFLNDSPPPPPPSSPPHLSCPTVTLQELDGSVAQHAGTGSRTWDSSVVMAMFLASRQDILQGHVLELGSGVGLGGILTYLLTDLHSCSSMTLTDYSLKVLQQCQANVRRMQHDQNHHHYSRSPVHGDLHVKPLDWYDFLNMTGNAPDFVGRYDTVLACDCAYRYQDMPALVRTMVQLLRKEPDEGLPPLTKTAAKIHVFGPSNRGGLMKLIEELRKVDILTVHLESIDMAKSRLDPQEKDISIKALSKYEYEFLHVECSLRPEASRDARWSTGSEMSDID